VTRSGLTAGSAPDVATLPASSAADSVQKRKCEVCGNEYDKAMEITQNGRVHVFDCFECAIHALAPACAHCGCRIVGHGMEHAKEMYCCAHCAQARGIDDLKDRS
jgi:hypothetical protein